MKTLPMMATLAALFALTACDTFREEKVERQTGELTRTLEMQDKSGAYYGTVELDPVGGGKVFDANGRLIGRIVSPE